MRTTSIPVSVLIRAGDLGLGWYDTSQLFYLLSEMEGSSLDEMIEAARAHNGQVDERLARQIAESVKGGKR